jgi:hypothetical protein
MNARDLRETAYSPAGWATHQPESLLNALLSLNEHLLSSGERTAEPMPQPKSRSEWQAGFERQD